MFSCEHHHVAEIWPLSGLKVQTEVNPSPKPTPLGMYPARVDDKGRLKLPVDIEEFLKGERLFVTSLDGRVGRIYPLPVWQENEKILFNDMDDPEGAEDLHMMADKYGSAAQVDPQGRVLLSPVLRRKMGVENQPVQLRHYQGVIHIYNAETYDEKERRAEVNAPDALKTFRRKGIK